eukprot:scaffold87978_cov54-Phaeocystis_antarctica.AAC.1
MARPGKALCQYPVSQSVKAGSSWPTSDDLTHTSQLSGYSGLLNQPTAPKTAHAPSHGGALTTVSSYVYLSLGALAQFATVLRGFIVGWG